MRWALALVLVVAAQATARAGDAQDPPPRSLEARAHRDAAVRLFDEERLEEARRECLAAQAIEPHPDVAYLLGQISRRLGDCEKARHYYEDVVQTTVSREKAQRARYQIQRCEAILETELGAPAASPAAEPSPTPEAVVAPQPSAAAVAASSVALPSPQPSRARRSDGLGIGLTAGGALVLTGGAVLFAYAAATIVGGADRYDRYAASQGAVPLEIAGAVAGAVGLVALVAGAARLAVIRRR
jgi:hypothetical protein